LPLVNVTQLDEILDTEWVQNGKVEKVKDTLQIEGVYPRWVGICKLSYQSLESTSKPLEFSSFFNLGNSKKEIEIGVAPGFPNATLGADDIIIPDVLA
jgi:hypothetical protein